MIDFKKAKTFVRQNGNDGERARLDVLLAGKLLSREVVTGLFADQRPDGGWAPFWAEDYSSLDATCFRLAQTEQLGIDQADPAVHRALSFLAERQAPDGSWQEDEEVAAIAPPWATPGDLSAALYLTANCGLWLALLSNETARATKAAAYLELHLRENGQLPGFLHTHWLAGALWHKSKKQEAAERVFTYLSERIGDLAISNLSWLITTLSAAGVAAHHDLVIKAASMLERAQEDDGRWRSEDGPAQDVHATLEALRALTFMGTLQ